MAAEVPVSDVLCEAMEYLSKLGANLRTRSESLKEKRISKDKLRNAHAVHKAARKVLLICELSKKSLENVETGVRKVLSIVDASQAQSDSGGKTIDKGKEESNKKYYYFEFESHKLRISKKIPIKHYMSVKVFAKGMPVSMQEKYPVFYDCKLKRRRRLSEKQKSDDKFERSLKRKNSFCHSDTNEETEKSKENQMEKAIESDASESEKSNLESRNKSGVSDSTKTNRRKSRNVMSNSDAEDGDTSDKTYNRGTTDSLVNQGDISQCKDDNNKQNNMNLVNSKNKNEPEKKKMNDNFRVSDLIESLNEAKVEDSLSKSECNIKKSQNSDDHKTNFEKHKRGEKEAINIRRKFSKIRIADESSGSDEDSLKNEHEKTTQKENQSSSGKENDFGLKKDITVSGPKSKKIKLTNINDDESKENSDHDSIESKKSEKDRKELDGDSKPIIRCVNITKLLKPDVLDAKMTKSPNDEQTKNNKHSKNENKPSRNHNKEQRKLSEDERVRKKNKNAMVNSNDEEFWAQKRIEVRQFKPKQFTVNIERLPKLSLNFLLAHNLKKIIQDAKTVFEVTKEKNNELQDLDKNIDQVKNALLNDSASDDTEIAVTTEARKVKESLLNDSDSDKEQTSRVVVNQKNHEQVTDSAAIKKAVLNQSDSENNEQVHDDGTVTNDSQIDLEQDITEKIKNALLNDSDSDKNQNKEDTNEIMPLLQETTNDDKCDAPIDSGDMAHKNKDDVCNVQPNTIKQNELTQDPEKIKSHLLNDSSDSKSESSVIEKIKTKLKMSKHKQKDAIKRMQAKKMLLNDSSSSDNENEHSQDSDKDSKKHTHKRGRKISRISSSSCSSQENASKQKKNDSRDSTPQEKRETEDEHSVNEDKDSRSIDQVDGTIDEHSDSSVSKMVRSKAKPSGSSGQNSDNQDASDKDIDGLTNLNNLNKTHRRRNSSSTKNTGTRSSVKKSSRSKPTPAIGEDLLHAVSSSDESEDENMGEEDLPPVKLPGLNGDSIGHLAKDDLLGDSDSSMSHKEQSEAEETQNIEDSEEEENVKARRRKANAISSDSDVGASRRKQRDEDVRISDFDDSEGESSESIKRSKRKKKGSESDASGSSNEEGTKKRRRIKQLRDSDASGSDTENEGRNKHGRKNIRKVMGKNQLEEATKKAAREEKERIARITERQKLYNNLEFDESGKPDEVVLEKVVLDFDPETKEPLIEVDRGLVKKLKPHQANGIKFMWDACFESVKRIKKDRGSGCILAHCMGLGKTLQVISLTHTLLIHGNLTGVNRVLVVCPLSTVLNWVNEFRMWLKHAHSEFEVDVYELSRYKQNSERAFQLQSWVETGGVCVLGYEMFRNLSADNNKKFKKKMLRTFQESLVDPGPDLVVCDEGHLLKNEKTSLSQSMNRVKTRRRIVLTGTPLQNNLKEYYCMVQFVKPNLLGKYNEYLNRFVNPITNGQYTDSTEYDIKVMKRRSHVLHKMLDGAVQRRDYGVLAPFLPPKHEFVLFITLSDVQVKLYQFYLDNYSRRPLPGKSSGFLFPDFQSLQRIWTHPLVLKYNSERYEIMQQKKREREEEDSEGSLVDFIDDDSTAEETSTEESSDDLSDASDDSRKKIKKKKAAKKSKVKESKSGPRRGTRANPVEIDDDEPVITEVVEAKNENPTEWWIKLVEDEELDDMRNSHKLVLLFDILRQCEAIGDKLLVFSQSLYSLDLIEHFLGKVDEATQEGRIDEKLGRHVGSWSPGVDYFRLDGSTSCENRSIWCKNFNREDNPRARLFLISTRAGGLGINLVAANRVVIFDVSWNPSHDVQSIFRVYRFGQKKPCYVYRFLAMGTMEEKIYERQVTKQAISKRVIDEQQIDRHYAENDLAELYKFEARPDEPRPLPSLPKDRLFAEMLREHEAQIYKYHEHDSLLENKEEETLSEEERKAAWEDFENEKNKPPPAPFQSPWPMPNGMVPGLFVQQQQQYAYAALAAMLRKDMPNINDNQIRDMLPLIYNSNPGLMQKMSEIYKYAQPGMMNPGMMNPVMNPAAASGGAGGAGGTSGLQYEPPWQRQHQQQQQMRLQQLMQHNQQMGAKFYAGGLGSRDPVAMALQQQRAREIMMGGGAGRPRGRPPLAPRAPAAPSQDVVNLDSD